MLAIDLITEEIPPLKTTDNGKTALQWMDDFKITELPVIKNSTYLGIVSETDLLDAEDASAALEVFQPELNKICIDQDEHIYEVMGIMSIHKVSILPVIDHERNYLGMITRAILVEKISNLAAIKDPGGILQIDLNVNDYSLSKIAAIVESNDAKILSSYVYVHDDSTKMSLTFKINRTDLSGIIQSFERYNYVVSASFHQSRIEEEMKRKFDEFLHFLNM
tara:strand:- start:54 stop:716 length:663 start_codon:yes stop_codon:yes gene_type:complete